MNGLHHFLNHSSKSLGLENPASALPEVLMAIGLSFALQCLISFVYKRTYRGSDYSQDYLSLIHI